MRMRHFLATHRWAGKSLPQIVLNKISNAAGSKNSLISQISRRAVAVVEALCREGNQELSSGSLRSQMARSIWKNEGPPHTNFEMSPSRTEIFYIIGVVSIVSYSTSSGGFLGVRALLADRPGKQDSCCRGDRGDGVNNSPLRLFAVLHGMKKAGLGVAAGGRLVAGLEGVSLM